MKKCKNCYMPVLECNCYNEILQDAHYEEQQEIFYYLNR